MSNIKKDIDNLIENINEFLEDGKSLVERANLLDIELQHLSDLAWEEYDKHAESDSELEQELGKLDDNIRDALECVHYVASIVSRQYDDTNKMSTLVVRCLKSAIS